MISLAVVVISLLTIAAGHGRMVRRSDDSDLHSLETLIQRQATDVQKLQAEVSVLRALKTDVEALKTKVAALSKTVAFTVHFTADDRNEGIPLGDNPVLLFDAVVTNIGNGYDPRTGMFTAPFRGTYAFFLTEMAPNNHGELNLDVMKEGQVLDETWAPGALDTDDQGSSSHVTTHLDAGQRVWVRHRNGDAVRGGYWTIFTGYLLHAE